VSYLLLRAGLGPELEQPLDDLLREGGVLLQELHDAVGQLRVVQRQAAHFMQGNQHLDQELLVLRLQGQGEPVDNGAEDLEQLAHAVEVLRLVDEAQEEVVDLLADEGAQPEEFAVDAVQDRLEEVPLPRVLAVKQLQQLKYELLVDDLLADARLKVGGLQETQKELVNQLQTEVVYYYYKKYLLFF